jgi:hypothetical protein
MRLHLRATKRAKIARALGRVARIDVTGLPFIAFLGAMQVGGFG